MAITSMLNIIASLPTNEKRSPVTTISGAAPVSLEMWFSNMTSASGASACMMMGECSGYSLLTVPLSSMYWYRMVRLPQSV